MSDVQSHQPNGSSGDHQSHGVSGHAAAGDIYMLNRDTTESQRLENQHKLYITSLGYHITPSALSTILTNSSSGVGSGPIRVVDVGTGTGAWLRSLAPTLPADAQLHGFDISDAQFPSDPSSLAPNISLSVMDMKGPIPENLLHSFDVVHLRLLLYALEREEWASTLKNVMRLAKPGAHVQWEEVDVTPTIAVRGCPAARIDTIQRGFETLYALSKPRCEFAVRDLWDAFHSCGLEDVRRDVVSSDRDVLLRRQATEMLPVLLEGAHGHIFGKESEQAKKAKVLADEVRKEADTGGYINFNIHSVSGKCP